MKRILFFMLSVLILGTACSNVPLTGRKQFTAIPNSQMLALSADSYSQVYSESTVSTNQIYLSRVKRVGENISAAVYEYLKAQGLESRIDGFDWQFTVFESDQVNAWCMPGGQIAFYEGIMPLCESDDAIAVVMGHEIAHAVARHGNERMTQQLAINMGGMVLSEALSTKKEETQQLALAAFGLGSQVGFALPYSRAHETEADELGLYFMAMAGYNPKEAPLFWEKMEAMGSGSHPPEFISTHPSPPTRIADLEKNMVKALEYYSKAKQ